MNNYSLFCSRISSFIPKKRIYTDELMTFSWGTDASFYRLTPKVVIRSEDEEEISKILSIASELKLPVTFRAAGTSLSGQSVSDSILIVAGKNWEKYSVGDDTVTLQPGIVGARVNAILKPYGRKFGPDPASIGSCMVGGIVMNNASGMSCGTHANSDKMILSVRIVLADGTVLDTSDEESKKSFMSTHKGIVEGIEKIRDEIKADRKLYDRIAYKYSIKNVTGLNLRPFIAYDDPFEIITHLIVGSEGTLAFMSEVKMKTLPIAPYNASAMIYFDDIKEAAKAVVAIKNCDICAAEMLDKRSLASVGDNSGRTAVLTQTEAETEEKLAENIKTICKCLEPFNIVDDFHFTSDKEECARYWAIRSGIFPTVGGMRKEGTTCLIEDIAFHIEDLPEATADLSELLDRHKYEDSCIYGHALEGNFHFIINQSFETDADVKRYEDMIRDVAKMVVEKYDGSLKAEHGTGRNMAPFVKYEWGESAFSYMRRIKNLFDPDSLLNPGVIFNDDELCFIKNFKAMPVLDECKSINKCIECGFCEVNCVSCGFTLSSRTRIAVMREIAGLENSGKHDEAEKLRKLYKYSGEETCAGDGLCSTSCPMGINVADLTHEIRRRTISNASRMMWNTAADHFSGTKNAIRTTLSLAEVGRAVLGNKIMAEVCKGLHNGLGIPLWTPAFPAAYRVPEKLSTPQEKDLKVVYFPSCFNQMMGPGKASPKHRPLVEETVSLLEKAGYEVIFPENKDMLCCGTIWESKGMPDKADMKLRELEEALLKASENGKYPVLCDQSPCLHRMRNNISSMHLYEPAEFIWKFLKDRLDFEKKDEPVVIHQTCSTRLMGLGGVLQSLAELCSSRVLVPEGVGCCGFAGDKGMTHPELNAWALRKLRKQIEENNIKVGYSNSRTCEIGLQTNSGIPYMSIVYLVNSCTKPKSTTESC